VVLSRDLDRRGVYPPIDVLPSLSRLMGVGVGAGRTREDHRPVADQLYALYARGRDVRRMAAIVGAANLGDEERRFLEFTDRFEGELVGQGGVFRTIGETLDLGWRLLSAFPPEILNRIPAGLVAAHRSQPAGAAGVGP
jgi:V/A-type H+-transporting ATPase subunit B